MFFVLVHFTPNPIDQSLIKPLVKAIERRIINRSKDVINATTIKVIRKHIRVQTSVLVCQQSCYRVFRMYRVN